ncbi:unnamed protein product, partial [Callosobruchus maculatus]
MMRPMVQQNRQTETQQQQNRRPQIALITQQGLQPLQEQIQPSDEEEQDAEEEAYRRRRRHGPLHRRFFTYVREAWSGLKTAFGDEFK